MKLFPIRKEIEPQTSTALDTVRAANRRIAEIDAESRAKAANFAKYADAIAQDDRLAAEQEAARQQRITALSDIDLAGSTTTDLPAVDARIADLEDKRKGTAERAAVARLNRERSEAARKTLQQEREALVPELRSLQDTALSEQAISNAPTFNQESDAFVTEFVKQYAPFRAQELLSSIPAGRSAVLRLAAELKIPTPNHAAFMTTEKPRVIAQEIETLALALLSDLSV